jgi:amino acid adenylation domain-containing protein
MQLNVLEYLERTVRSDARNEEAIIEGTSSITFQELMHKAQTLATHIALDLEGTKHPVVVLLPRSIEAVVADLAILYSGNFYSNVDLKSPPERLARLISNINPIALITTDSELSRIEGIDDFRGKVYTIDSKSDSLDSFPNYELLNRIREQMIDTDPMCLVNTSGSTGTPKSVVINHRSVIDYVDWWTDRFDFSNNEIFGSMTPFHFDHFTADFFVGLKTAAKIHLIPDHLSAFPKSLVDFLKEHQVTFCFWVPTVMVNIANLNVLDASALKYLRRIFFAGEVFPTKQLNMWRRALPHVEFVNLYGPTEITVDCTYYVVDRDFKDDAPIPIGSPCRNSDVFILNDENRLAKPGEIGELCVRGSSLAMGYYNNPEQTSKAFVQNPLNSAYPELIYRTGDLVHTNERGEIMFDGRKDFQIKHQGYRIELAEIETAVQALDAIDNACVLYNKSKKSIILIFESNREVNSKILRTQLQERLPKYMFPTVFIEVEEMPRNSNGKIDRQVLSSQYAQ